MSDLTLDSLLQSLEVESESTGMDKVASEAPVSVAEELQTALTKEASENTGEVDTMSNVGKEIADSILAMLDGQHEKVAENTVIADIDKMVAQDDAIVELTPREGKTVTETAKALQARGAHAGHSEEEGVVAEKEGGARDPIPAVASDLDKKAAIDELIADGVNFDEAVELVKQASAQLEAENADLEKAAAVDHLIAEGIDFEQAVELVKQASAEEVATEYSDLEKSAAVSELIAEDGIAFADAVAMVKEAAALGK